MKPNSNNKYLEKVRGEITVYQRYLLEDGQELTPVQAETFKHINDARDWLKEGYSDGQVLAMIKKTTALQDRRAREILAMSYVVFAELRSSRDKEGVKYLYSEMFREAAKKALDDNDYYNYSLLLKEAAKIDGAYDNQKVVDAEAYKKPSKVVFKIKSVTVNNSAQNETARQIQEATYEQISE
ncbi:hypothetical protein GO730_05895 [Spirosoma sp. HMF3257]|uniref:Uncharacterized protein n=1 Tax=Spirosoma telluris TaxID=2183553 RepID=A0A327NN26_9BACT|nr:hypothetical protein [Spirosoma telluris]RAI74008.1 hypothetical protein HMF3257_05850 [Spirosoma telluris]